MREMETSFPGSDDLGASLLVRRFEHEIAGAAGTLPIADIACGSGRNAFALARLNSVVFCVDKDLSRLQNQAQLTLAKGVKALQIDLVKDPWPFGARSLGGIISVHFLLPALFPFFIASLAAGGLLLIETVPGCGGNYVQLPRAGELRDIFSPYVEWLYYKERRVGPQARNAAVVRLVGRRNNISLASLNIPGS